MSSWKAKKLGKLTQDRVLLELEVNSPPISGRVARHCVPPVISTSDNIQCILRMGVTSRVPGDCWTPRDAHPSQHASATLHVRQTHGGCPARASRDSDSPYGDRIAVRYRPCGGGDASAASGWVARQGALGDAGWWCPWSRAVGA